MQGLPQRAYTHYHQEFHNDMYFHSTSSHLSSILAQLFFKLNVDYLDREHLSYVQCICKLATETWHG